ncbi:MAG: response regulator transcription factor [Chloroflexi bacterium]|nr:response regulator transcription factor [Chloroflexota bacterium]
MDEMRLLILADDPLARAGLAMLLGGQTNYILVNQWHSQSDWQTELEETPLDVVVWDLGWDPPEPLLDMREAGVPVVALMTNEGFAAAAWSVGAKVLLRRDSEVEKLKLGIDAAAAGLILIDPTLAMPLLPHANGDDSLLTENLTSREKQVLQLLAEGLPNKNIARQLGISEHTIKFHVNAIMNKLGAQSRTEAVVRATRAG